jgi:hypothetical protein
MASSRKKATKGEFECRYCNKAFVRETTLAVHMCTVKHRDLNKDAASLLAYRVYERFQRRHVGNKKLEWPDFIRNRHFNDFYRVGKYIRDINPPLKDDFINYLVNSSLPIQKWNHPTIYETYIREMTKKEDPRSAVDRSIRLMQQWSGSTGEHWTDFFRAIAPSQAAQWIRSGRLSPWIIYICPGSSEMVARFTEEHWKIIGNALDAGFWKLKMARHAEDVRELQDALTGANL